MPNLYEISTEVRSLLEQPTDDGEIPLELAERLDGLQLTIANKVEHCCRAMRQYECDAVAVKSEVDRLKEMQSAIEGKAEWIRDYLLKCLQTAGIERMDTELFKLWIQNNPLSADLEKGAEVPEGFQKIKIELDKKRALEVAKSGGILPGEIIISRGQHLRIK